MLVEHFTGKKECDSEKELMEILKERTHRNVNEFIISTDKPFPYMVMAVNQEKACLSYFREEDDPGYSSVNNDYDGDDGNSIFYTNTDSEEIEVANYSIINTEIAISAVMEFFNTKKLPKCVEWEEM